MKGRRRRPARCSGVVLELAVLEYLRGLSEREDRDRSFCINRIVREHAERHGHLLPTDLPHATPPEQKEA